MDSREDATPKAGSKYTYAHIHTHIYVEREDATPKQRANKYIHTRIYIEREKSNPEAKLSELGFP